MNAIFEINRIRICQFCTRSLLLALLCQHFALADSEPNLVESGWHSISSATDGVPVPGSSDGPVPGNIEAGRAHFDIDSDRDLDLLGEPFKHDKSLVEIFPNETAGRRTRPDRQANDFSHD